MLLRRRQFLVDLSFVITLLIAVFSPVVALRLLGADPQWGLTMTELGVTAPLAVFIFGVMAPLQQAMTLPVDFFTLCGWPLLSWALLSLTLRLRMDLGARFGEWAGWTLTLVRLGATSGLIWLYGHCYGVGGWVWVMWPMLALALCAMLMLRRSALARRLDFEVMAGFNLSEQLVWPWFVWAML